MNDRSTLHPSTRSRVPGLSTMKPLALLVHTLCLGALASVAGAPAQAQTVVQTGQPESLRHYAIPAGPLEATLNRLGREAGLLIAFGSAATEGLRSGGVSGSYTVDDALARALAGTGLAAVRTAGGGYALRAASTPVAGAAGDGVQTMAPVTVSAQGEEENPWGKVSGYVARRASTATKTDASLLEVPQSETTAAGVAGGHAGPQPAPVAGYPSPGGGRGVLASRAGRPATALHRCGLGEQNHGLSGLDRSTTGVGPALPAAVGVLAAVASRRVEP